MHKVLEQLLTQQHFSRAYTLQVRTLKTFHQMAAELGGQACPIGQPDQETLSPERNFFSCLYLSVITEMVTSSGYLPLYAMVNQAMRACVTAGDNILDDEYKPVFDFRFEAPGGRIRSILTIMLADRVVEHFAAREYADFDILHDTCWSTLQALAPSLLEDGTEEERPVEVLPPGEITTRIHTRRTANLFLAPLALPTSIEEIDPALLAYGRASLKHFGLSYQILDDIRDMPDDMVGGRHNLCVSLLHEQKGHQEGAALVKIIREQGAQEWTAWDRFPDVVRRAAQLACEEMQTAYENLHGAGSQIAEIPRREMTGLVCELLGVAQVADYLPPDGV